MTAQPKLLPSIWTPPPLTPCPHKSLPQVSAGCPTTLTTRWLAATRAGSGESLSSQAPSSPPTVCLWSVCRDLTRLHHSFLQHVVHKKRKTKRRWLSAGLGSVTWLEIFQLSSLTPHDSCHPQPVLWADFCFFWRCCTSGCIAWPVSKPDNTSVSWTAMRGCSSPP